MQGASAELEGLRLRFVMDDAYFRRFHTELVAHAKPGWRIQRRLGAVAMAAGLGLGVVGWGAGHQVAALIGLGLAGLGLAMISELVRRRRAWLSYQRQRPVFGREIVFVVHRGQLVRVAPGEPDMRVELTGRAEELQEGWRLPARILAMDAPPEGDAVSQTEASIYLPHDACEPPASRDALARLFEGMEIVRRAG